MKKRVPIIFSGVVVVLVVCIVAFAFVLHTKNERIERLEKARSVSALNQSKSQDTDIAGLDFQNLNVNITNDGKDKIVNMEYKLQGQKEETLKNIKLENQKGKFVVTGNSNLTNSEKEVVEKVVNDEKNINNNIKEEIVKENQFAENMQNEMNKQFSQMNKQFQQMNKQFNQAFNS